MSPFSIASPSIAPGSGTLALTLPMQFGWSADRWLVPADLVVSRLFKIGTRPVKIGVGTRYIAQPSPNGSDWGVLLKVTLPFRMPGSR